MNSGFDILIKDTTIIDGSGKPAFQGSVGIKGDKIAAMGDIKVDAARTIDAQGLMVCPGFVDPHNHGDMSILQHPRAENLVMQGITTIVGGNCGFCPGSLREGTHTSELGVDYPVDWNSYGEWLSKVEAVGPAVNILSLVGHNTIREMVMGEDFRRAASDGEVDAMKPLVEEAMKSGAFGLSVGLDMPWPG
jgi:N-acyl-D-aspartate/D-glutamate deacylase